MVARPILGLAALVGVLTFGAVAHATLPAVVATVPVGSGPGGIAITPNGAFAYVTNSGNAVSVIDTSSNTVVATATVASGPLGIAITPDGAYAFTPAIFANRISVIGTAFNNEVLRIPAANGMAYIAITPNGAFAYVTLPNDGVQVYSTSLNNNNGSIVFIPTGGHGSSALAITPNGAFVYVGNSYINTVSVIDTSSNTVVGSPIVVGNFPRGVAITPNGAFVYVANASDNGEVGDNCVSVIDTSSNAVVATVNLGRAPTGIAITPDGAFAYVGNLGEDTVSVIDTSTNTVVGSPIAVGHFPGAIAITPNGVFAYVVNSGDGTLSVIQLKPLPPPTPTVSGGTSATPDTDTIPGQVIYTLTQTANPGAGNVYTMTVPAGTTFNGPVTVSAPGNKPAIAVNVTMPPGETKSISLPKGTGTKVCVVDHANATIGGNGSCTGGLNLGFPASGCGPATNVPGDPGDGGSAPNYFHPVTVCRSGNVITVNGLKHSALSMVVDSDDDGVTDDLDHCPSTVLMSPNPQTRNNHLDDSQTLLGCTRTQVLACKPGNNNGEVKFGLTPGSQNIFNSKMSSNPQGWANQCNQLYPNPTP